jgi:cobalt-precorrin-5B (C1)-methyltransferase
MSRLREGFTTGSCATAAAKAATHNLLTGEHLQEVTIETPVGRQLTLPVHYRGEGIFAVIKDAGDDPDVTHGLPVVVKVELSTKPGPIQFVAGEGVGTVTLPGLKIPPGEPAINPVPREMIERELRAIIGQRAAQVSISIPGGKAVARKTFNPRLGIVNGLSILGTSGIVRPMSQEAIQESIALEMSVKHAQGKRALGLTFGATGEKVTSRAFGIPVDNIVQISNYVGFALHKAADLGLIGLLLSGHPGKLVKVAGGIFQTHSRVADARLEILCAHAALLGAPTEVVRHLYNANTTEAAIDIIHTYDLDSIWSRLAETAALRCWLEIGSKLQVAIAFVDNIGRVLGQSENTLLLIKEVRGECMT